MNTPSRDAREGGLRERDYVRKHAKSADQVAAEHAAKTGEELDPVRAAGVAELSRDRAVRDWCDQRPPVSFPSSPRYRDAWDRMARNTRRDRARLIELEAVEPGLSVEERAELEVLRRRLARLED